jgi:adenylate cyclase class IV
MNYEIEIKALLGSQEKIDELLSSISNDNDDFHKIDEQKQLNHYFKGKSIKPLLLNVASYYSEEQNQILREISAKAMSFTVRSREKNNRTFLVVKGSLDSASADHSHRRMEFEEPINLSIEALDVLIEESDLVLEAKWSAERIMYTCRDMVLDIMFSPGYGYVVEFEKVIKDESLIEETRGQLLATMKEYGVEELDSERLARMFAYYNSHWQEYYGTRKVFVIE